MINTRSILFLMLIIFGQFLQSCGPWSMSEFCLCSISYELICGFRSNFVYTLILTRCIFRWLNNIFCSFSTELWPLIYVEILFMLIILWTNWWILSEFCFHLISWEQIDGFWWYFLYAVLWLAHEIFLNFSTELWPLIDVKISIFRNNEWIMIKFCLCIDIYDPCCDLYTLFSWTFQQGYDHTWYFLGLK